MFKKQRRGEIKFRVEKNWIWWKIINHDDEELIDAMNFVARFLKNFFPILSIFDYNFWSREFIRNASLVKWREKWTWKRGQCNLEALPRIQKTLMHFQLEDLCLQRHKWCLKKWMCFQTRVFVPNKESFLRGRDVTKAKDGFHSFPIMSS